MLTCKVISTCDMCSHNTYLDLPMPNSELPGGKYRSSLKDIYLQNKHYMVCNKCFSSVENFIKKEISHLEDL